MGNFDVTKALINVINAGINGKELLACEDWGAVFKMAKKHSLGSLFYLAIKDDKSMPEEIIADAKKHFSAQTAQQIMQEYSESKLFEEFSVRGIKYMPLKGHFIKKLYPYPEMRTSCDIDVFYDKGKRDVVLEILSNLGFTLVSTSEYDDHWSKDVVTIETHFNLASNEDNLQKYYSDIWQRLKTDDGKEFYFTDEDFYIYLMVHAAKHFLSDGFGIRTVLDFYLFKKNKNLDQNYLEKEFEKLGLNKFVKSFVHLSEVWFGDETATEETDILCDYVVGARVYGTENRGVIMRNISKSGSASATKRAFIFRRIFPPFKEMSERYKVLKKCVILLPFMWIIRWFEAIFFRRKNIKKIYNESKMIKSEDVDVTTKILDITGLKKD